MAGRPARGRVAGDRPGRQDGPRQPGRGGPGALLLAAYAPQAAAVVGQLRVDARTNEPKAALRLLGVFPPLGGAVVTGDAMFAHRDVCDAVHGRGGDYLLFVQDNQGTLRADLTAAFAADFSPLPAAAVG